MNIDLYTYEEKKGEVVDGYYMLVVTAKENNILKVIPKDVFFIIDTSSSIGSGRLFEFKSGVTRSLQDFNPNDRFNLITFRKTAQNYSKTFLPYSPDALAGVRKFLGGVDSEGRTDIFRALLPLAALPREQDRMRMAILMSDGNANEGEKNATRIINEFTARNKRNNSLFGLSGAKNVNQFLLEFLAYQNQGLTRDVRSENLIGQEFHQFFRSVRDPLLMDLEFKFAGTNPDQVFPRNLPHIYQNTPLRIYGRYDPQSDKMFTMQILGNSFGTTKELLARQSFDKAKKGTRQIALDWGKQKTYHLIGRTLMHDSPELQSDIQRTAREYDVDVSFLK
jgi:Ca-activated chloride channel family protein